MRDRIDFNDGWLFEGREAVRLPHNAVDLPFSYFDETAFQKPFTYEKRFEADPGWAGRDIFLCFEAAMADARVRLNGEEIARHADGYTPFRARLTGRLKPGTNEIAVTVNGAEDPAIPPFGDVIDYLTYAGIYRDCRLEVRAPVSIARVKIETPEVLADEKRLLTRIWLEDPGGAGPGGRLSARLLDAAGRELAREEAAAEGDETRIAMLGLKDIALWSPENPVLYTLEVTLAGPSGGDRVTERFGFRHVRFTPQGFRLNGEARKLRGLNRHQSFPYVGYALGTAAQRRDAEILKRELKLDIVRTSHYPQSPDFLDACDELGLMVFEEIPGWQHIGDATWQDRAVENVGAMIRRDWNHPSIVLWGVRINESLDDHEFYSRTNALAHELDSTRPTGGVRYLAESELLEDVYTMNDFILGQEELGGNRPRTPLRPQAEVTGLDRAVPYLVTEYGGHMYPTKSWDQESRQAEHVLRHLEVLNAMYGDPQVAGAIGWCAFDYNTHKDFGAGDRICHHGVMDMFREPKFAAWAYASQADPSQGAILKPVTFWARGERAIGGVLPLIVLSNCDEVELRYGDAPPKRLGPDVERFGHLPHPPVIFERQHFTADEIGHWGMRWEAGEITGYVNGRAVAKARFAADPVASELQVVPDASVIGAHDAVRVMVRALDQAGNKLPFCFEPVAIAVSGAGRRIGPGLVPLRGGAAGFWVQAEGAGRIRVEVASERLGRRIVHLVSG